MSTNIAVLVHFKVSSNDGVELTRDEAKQYVNHLIDSGYVEVRDEGDPQPFVQLTVPALGTANISVLQEDPM